MRKLGWAILVTASVVSGCKCGSKKTPDAADAGPQIIDAGTVAEAPVSAPVKMFRESDTAFQQGKPDEAIAKAQQVVQQQPQNALAHNLIGRSFVSKFEQSKDPAEADKAREAFRKAFEVDPRFWPAMLNLADLEEKTGNIAAAAAAYAKVLELEPTHPDKARFEATIQKAKPSPKK